MDMLINKMGVITTMYMYIKLPHVHFKYSIVLYAYDTSIKMKLKYFINI